MGISIGELKLLNRERANSSEGLFRSAAWKKKNGGEGANEREEEKEEEMEANEISWRKVGFKRGPTGDFVFGVVFKSEFLLWEDILTV